MLEIWKDITNYEGLYQVSNTGKIKSFHNDENGKIINPHISRGYAFISLSKNGKRTHYLVHRLVANAFIPNPNGYKEINHIDENKLNNAINNLEWCTREYNMAYGSARIRQGISCGNPVEQMVLDDTPIAKYCSVETAAKINNLDPSSIIKCCKGSRKHAGGYRWRYISNL